jgi:hypothetical protein
MTNLQGWAGQSPVADSAGARRFDPSRGGQGKFPKFAITGGKTPVEIRGKCGKELEKSLSFAFPKLLPGEH